MIVVEILIALASRLLRLDGWGCCWATEFACPDEEHPAEKVRHTEERHPEQHQPIVKRGLGKSPAAKRAVFRL